MHIGVEPLGRLGGTLMFLTAVTGVALGTIGVLVHGAPGAGSGLSPGTPTAATPASGGGAPGGSSGSPGSTTPGGGANGTATSKSGSSGSTKAPALRFGPTLAASGYQPYSFQVFPGSGSQGAKVALSGFAFHATHVGSEVKGLVTALGSSQVLWSQTVPANYRMYAVDSNPSDDAPPSGEYGGSDDGFLATSPQGRIVLP